MAGSLICSWTNHAATHKSFLSRALCRGILEHYIWCGSGRRRKTQGHKWPLICAGKANFKSKFKTQGRTKTHQILLQLLGHLGNSKPRDAAAPSALGVGYLDDAVCSRAETSTGNEFKKHGHQVSTIIY